MPGPAAPGLLKAVRIERAHIDLIELAGFHQMHERIVIERKRRLEHFLAQFGPALQWPWTHLTDVPELTDELLEKTGLKGQNLPPQRDRNAWAQLRSRLEAIFRTKTRDEWCAIMEGSDVCFAPVLS